MVICKYIYCLQTIYIKLSLLKISEKLDDLFEISTKYSIFYMLNKYDGYE